VASVTNNNAARYLPTSPAAVVRFWHQADFIELDVEVYFTFQSRPASLVSIQNPTRRPGPLRLKGQERSTPDGRRGAVLAASDICARSR